MDNHNDDIYTRICIDVIDLIKHYGPICIIRCLLDDMRKLGCLPVPSSFVANILNLAVLNGCIYTIEPCLEIANPMSDTIAIAGGKNPKILNLLLEVVDREGLFIDFNAVFNGETAMERAAGNIETMQILLKRGALITTKALINAARLGMQKHFEPIAFLLDEIEKRNLQVDMNITHNNTTLLTEVMWYNFPKGVIYQLVRLGAKPNNTEIILSVMHYNYNIVKLFLDIVEKCNIPVDLNTPIHASKEIAIEWAVRKTQPDTVKLLLENGAVPTNEAVVWAARNCDLDSMLLLLASARRCKFVIDWNYKMCDATALEWLEFSCGFNPELRGQIVKLMFAICRGNESILQEIESGKHDILKQTLTLSLAVCCGSKSDVKAILKARAQPDKKLLTLAIISGSRAIVKLLYNPVAKKNNWDFTEETPFMIARKLKCRKIAGYINRMEARQSFNYYEKLHYTTFCSSMC